MLVKGAVIIYLKITEKRPKRLYLFIIFSTREFWRKLSALVHENRTKHFKRLDAQ